MRATRAVIGRRGRRSRRTAFLAAVLLLACGLSAAAAPAGDPTSLDARYFQRSWRRSNGLPGNSVYAIAQAADGYLWVGTENGLARFDGQRFVAYGAGQPAVFRSRLVGALGAARDGTLWVGTERGLLHMRGTSVTPDGPAGGLTADAPISALAEDAGGDLWIGTRLGLLRRSAASGKVTRIGLANTRIVQLLTGEAGEVWIGTEARGPWRFRHGRLERVDADPRLWQGAGAGLVRGEDGSILVFTERAVGRFWDGSEVSAAPGKPAGGQGGTAGGAGGGRPWVRPTGAR